eukprot:scaffold7921_cov109-Isochrysis_galbana.AAC.7
MPKDRTSALGRRARGGTSDFLFCFILVLLLASCVRFGACGRFVEAPCKATAPRPRTAPRRRAQRDRTSRSLDPP